MIVTTSEFAYNYERSLNVKPIRIQPNYPFSVPQDKGKCLLKVVYQATDTIVFYYWDNNTATIQTINSHFKQQNNEY